MAPDPGEFTIDAILCDSAATCGGKLFLQGGGWHTITAQSFPVRQSRIGIGMVIGIPYTATNQGHKLEVALFHQDGAALAPDGTPVPEDEPEKAVLAGGDFNIGRPPLLQAGERQTIGMGINFDQLRFVQPGSYSFRISIDGKEINRLEFRVVGVNAVTVAAG
jgi:hypothetical protein